jgi:hypothetical protein
MNDNPAGPSRAYYGLAVAVLVAGIALFVVVLWKGISSIPSRVQQVVAPGRAELTLSTSGDYTIFYEYRSVIGNRVYSTGEDVPGLECTLTSKAIGATVPLKDSTLNSNYTFGGRSGRSVFDFYIDRPGTYELTSSYREGRKGEEVVLAVGPGDIAMKMVKMAFLAVGILLGSIVLTIAIVLITAIKRHNAAKRRQTSSGPPPPIE